MPNLLDHKSSSITKILLEGDSGTGKTTALATLVEDGFKLRIWDFDNGLDGLVNQIRIRCPALASNVEYETFRDQYRSTEFGPMLFGTPDALTRAAKRFDKWADGSTPSKWGPEYIAVIDSLTHFSNAAYNWAKLICGALTWIEGTHPPGINPQNIYHTAQRAVLAQIAALTSESFNTNLIVISHIKYSERADGTTKGFPNTVGSAIGPQVLTYFNNHVLAFESKLEGGQTKRQIRTRSTFLLDLKTAAQVPEVLDAHSGLSKFFTRPKRSL